MKIGNNLILEFIGNKLWGPATDNWNTISDEQKLEVLEHFDVLETEDDLIELNDFIAYDSIVCDMVDEITESLSESNNIENDIENDIEKVKEEIGEISERIISNTMKGDKVMEGKETNGVESSYYKKFKDITNRYISEQGEGETLATQAVTAVNKIIYKWYNDGDTYDTTTMQGWANDLTSFANWLAKYVDGAESILDKIYDLRYNDESGYERILKELADYCFNAEFLAELDKQSKEGSIYDCDGNYVFEEYQEDEEDYYDEDEEDYYDEDEYEDDWDEDDELEESFGIRKYSEKLNEAKVKIDNEDEDKEDDKTILDLIQDRIGQDISVGELNTMLQSIFGKFNEVFLLSNMLYNADIDEPQELVIDDDNDMYTITFTIKDLEEALIEITDVVVE